MQFLKNHPWSKSENCNLNNNILFLTLRIFSATGGIEKVCRCIGKILNDISATNTQNFDIYSLYDKKKDAIGNNYFSLNKFSAFNARKSFFILKSLFKSKEKRIVILSHVNLLPIGWIIKKIFPAKRLILIAHGIEIWKPFSWFRNRMLHVVDEFVSVSNFTKNKIVQIHQIPDSKCCVINNCIDPFMESNVSEHKILQLRVKHNIGPNDKIVFSLTRLSKEDRKKGCENVVKALKKVNKINAGIKYIIGGNIDNDEKKNLTALALSIGLSDCLIFPGFIHEEELGAYYKLSDLFILPSIKEGFGIVFLEAMYYGIPAIGGNLDGSVDAFCNGCLGKLIDPLSISAIEDAMIDILIDKKGYYPDKDLLISEFSYNTYKSRWNKLLFNPTNHI